MEPGRHQCRRAISAPRPRRTRCGNYASWQFSQFLHGEHGEQGAMVCAARIVESVPGLDAKPYSATRTMDEARHAAFGRMALRDYCRQPGDAEPREREEFVIEGCHLMRDRLRGVEVLENSGTPRQEAQELSERSEFLRLFRKLLFSRIVPCVKDIGLWGERLQKAYLGMGVFEMGDSSLDLLMTQDEEIAEALDRQRFEAEDSARVAETEKAISRGAA